MGKRNKRRGQRALARGRVGQGGQLEVFGERRMRRQKKKKQRKR